MFWCGALVQLITITMNLISIYISIQNIMLFFESFLANNVVQQNCLQFLILATKVDYSWVDSMLCELPYGRTYEE